MHDDSVTRGRAVDLALAFVKGIEAGRDTSDLLTGDAVEEELPNRWFERGATRDVAAMRAGMERGRTVFRRQSYAVESAIGDDRRAALELAWTGELAIPLGPLEAGAAMRARAAFFFELRGDKIARIRHYDCFDPFPK
jgi:hypothetical protein